MATVDLINFPQAKKFMKPTSNDHISVALKKKLIRRMEFTKFKKQFLQNQKIQMSNAKNSKYFASVNDININKSNSVKNFEFNFLKPMQSTENNETENNSF